MDSIESEEWMKYFCLLGLLLLPVFALAQTAEQKVVTTMSREDRAKIIKLLEDSQKETLAMLKGLSDAQWNYKAAPERWSVGECAEHIWLSESLLFAQVEKALSNPENPNWAEATKGKDEFVYNVLTNRKGKAQAPEQIKPTGKTRDEILKGLKESRAKTLKFAKSTEAALKSHTQDHIFKVFGTLNAYQWLLYIPAHNLRHNQQIAEVKASPGFPK
jgi:hypothetical protein